MDVTKIIFLIIMMELGYIGAYFGIKMIINTRLKEGIIITVLGIATMVLAYILLK